MLDFSGLNWWAVLAATVVAFIIGGLWYGPLFGKAWMHELGKTEADIEPTPAPFIISFITAFLTSVVLAALIQNLGVQTLSGGLILGALVGLGFIATAMASDSAFCGWSANLFFIQSGYRVLYSVVMGGILAYW